MDIKPDDLKKIIQNLPCPVLALNKRGQITCATKSAKDLLDLTLEDIRERDLKKLFTETPDFLSNNNLTISSTIDLGIHCLVQNKKMVGVVLNPLSSDDYFSIIVTFYEIEPLFKEKDLLEASLFKTAFLSSPTGLLIVNEKGIIRLSNYNITVTFGYTAEQLLGKEVEILLPEKIKKPHVKMRDSFFLNPEPRLLGAGRDLYGQNKQGDLIPIEVGLNPVKLNNEILVIVSIIEISERKKNEDLKLQLTNKTLLDEKKNEFIAQVSHELKTPLTVIKEGISLVEENLFENINFDQNKSLLFDVKKNIVRLSKLIEDLLDISKIESGKYNLYKQKIDANSFLNHILEQFRLLTKKKNLMLENSINEHLFLYADENLLEEVFYNLLDNAIKFTEKGHIKISAKELDQFIEFCISDTGCGLSEEEIPFIFDKFQQFNKFRTAKTKGTGLGLAIVKGIIELHKGVINVKSSKDKGTKLIFTIPKFIENKKVS